MKRYEITIKGANPCLMNKLDNELIKETKQIPKDKLEEWEHNNWKRKAYWDLNGNEIKVPDTNIHSMIIGGCKKYKVSPPRSIGRTWTDYFKSSVVIEDSFFSYDKIEPFVAMVNGNPSSIKKSSKVLKVRPKFSGWDLKLVLVDLQDYLNEDVVSEIMKTTGSYVGFGDYRPQHGRFQVVKVRVI